MTEQDEPDPAFDTMTSRMLRREALRRAAMELSTTTPAGLEDALAKISAEVTAEAAEQKHGAPQEDQDSKGRRPLAG